MSNQIQHLLDRPIAFQRAFVAIGAGITGALMLSQALYWAKRSDGGWFYKSQADWEDETGMTRYEQEGARKTLRGLGVLEEKRVGVGTIEAARAGWWRQLSKGFCIHQDAGRR